MSPSPFAVSALVVSLTLVSASGARAQAVGDEFQVNTYTTGSQEGSAVSTAANGDFVVVWESGGSSGSDTSLFSIQAQRYASDGTPRGASFQVNDYTTGDQRLPRVAVQADGDFVVVWHSAVSPGDDASNDSVQGQRYASDGGVVGGQFQVNTYTGGQQRAAVVGVAASGDFVVAWHSYGSSGDDLDGYSTQVQRYASDGSPRGGELQANTHITASQGFPVIAVEPDGDFVVAWTSGDSATDPATYSVQGQRYASDGTLRGGEFQANTLTTADQYRPSIAGAADGAFVMSWESGSSGGGDSAFDSVQVRRFASDGSAQGLELQVNTYTSNSQNRSAVALEADGDFVVSWRSQGSASGDTNGDSVQARRFASDGAARGAELQVNAYTTGSQAFPAVSMAPGGGFVITWTSATQDAGNPGVFGRRFQIATLAAADTSSDEGDPQATFTVTLSQPAAWEVAFDWSTALIGGAASGVDYVASSGTVSLAAGQTQATFTVPLLDDEADEGPEYFFVNLANPTGATVADGQARCLISDDDPAPVLAFGAAEPVNTEGDTGSAPQSFTVTLTGATARTVDVAFATGSAGTAVSGADYAPKTGTLRFTPGQTSKVIKVQLNGDVVDEARETYFVNLSAPLNATIGDTQAMGTIVDNDPTPAGSPSLTIGNAAVVEGNAGTVLATFTVSLSAAATTAVSFTYGTGAGGTATSGVDYVGFVLKTATIAVGQSSKTVTVTINGDTLVEPGETYFVNVTSASNAVIVDGQGQGTITNDDVP